MSVFIQLRKTTWEWKHFFENVLQTSERVIRASACVWTSTGSGTNPVAPGLSQTIHLCQAASTDSACGCKQSRTRQSTIHNQEHNHYILSRSSTLPLFKAKVIFYSLFLGWASNGVNLNLQSASVSKREAARSVSLFVFKFWLIFIDGIS